MIFHYLLGDINCGRLDPVFRHSHIFQSKLLVDSLPQVCGGVWLWRSFAVVSRRFFDTVCNCSCKYGYSLALDHIQTKFTQFLVL